MTVMKQKFQAYETEAISERMILWSAVDSIALEEDLRFDMEAFLIKLPFVEVRVDESSKIIRDGIRLRLAD